MPGETIAASVYFRTAALQHWDINLPTMDEREIQIKAHKLLDQHGNKAIDIVMQCINQAGELGDEGAVLLWGRVFDVIDAHERDRIEATRH